jgi:hypothetical protein
MKLEKTLVIEGSIGTERRAAWDGSARAASLPGPGPDAGHYSCSSGGGFTRAGAPWESSKPAAASEGSRGGFTREISGRRPPSDPTGLQETPAERPPPGAA